MGHYYGKKYRIIKDGVHDCGERLLIFEFNSLSAMKQRVDWPDLFMAKSEPLCLFPKYRARTVLEHPRLCEF